MMVSMSPCPLLLAIAHEQVRGDIVDLDTISARNEVANTMVSHLWLQAVQMVSLLRCFGSKDSTGKEFAGVRTVWTLIPASKTDGSTS